MQSFTGPEIAAMVQVGIIIASSKEFSDLIRNTHPIMRKLTGLEHWLEGVYLITAIEPGEKVLKLLVEDSVELDGLLQRLQISGQNGYLRYTDQEFLLYSISGETVENDCLHAIRKAKLPAELVFESKDSSQEDILAVNMVRKFEPDELQISQIGNVSDAEVQHYFGGPCEEDSISCFIVTGGPQGYRILSNIQEAKEFVNCQARIKHDGVCPGNIVNIMVQGQPTIGIVTDWNQDAQKWEISICNDDSQCLVIMQSPNEVEFQQETKLMVFWGNARWNRAQLLGEIAKGSWGMTMGNSRDIIPTTKKWNNIYDRLVFAPPSPMSEDYSTVSRMNSFRIIARRAFNLH